MGVRGQPLSVLFYNYFSWDIRSLVLTGDFFQFSPAETGPGTILLLPSPPYASRGFNVLFICQRSPTPTLKLVFYLGAQKSPFYTLLKSFPGPISSFFFLLRQNLALSILLPLAFLYAEASNPHPLLYTTKKCFPGPITVIHRLVYFWEIPQIKCKICALILFSRCSNSGFEASNFIVTFKDKLYYFVYIGWSNKKQSNHLMRSIKIWIDT